MLEFLSSRNLIIDLVNSGKMPLKARGKNKQELDRKFQEARRKTVEQIKSTSSSDASKHKAMTVQRYKQLHNDRTQQQDGLKTEWRCHKGQNVECVLFALEEEGEACAHACRESRASNSLEPRAPKRGKVQETGHREPGPWGTEHASYNALFQSPQRQMSWSWFWLHPC